MICRMRNPISKEDLLGCGGQFSPAGKALSVVNEIDEGLIYLQITLGVGRRTETFAFRSDTTEPTDRVVTQSQARYGRQPRRQEGASVISIEDIPWRPPRHQDVQLLSRRWAK